MHRSRKKWRKIFNELMSAPISYPACQASARPAQASTQIVGSRPLATCDNKQYTTGAKACGSPGYCVSGTHVLGSFRVPMSWF